MKRLFLALCILTGASYVNPIQAGPPASVTINGLTVPTSVISNYAPQVGLHYWEQYLPCSIDYILTNATLMEGAPSDYAADLDNGTPLLVHPTQQQLYQFATNDPAGTNHYLSIDQAAYTGGPPPGTAPPYDSSVLTNVPMYASIQVPTDASFVDVNFYFLYAYNGQQTIRGLEPSRHFNAALPHFAEHQGDIEDISVRITPDFKSVIFVRYEAHGNSTYYAPSEVPFVGGTHPMVDCALFSHSSYNPNGLNANDWIDLADEGLAEVVDVVNPAIYWEPYNYGNVVLVGIDPSGQPVNGQLWAAFAGRMGIHQLNNYEEANGIGSDLPIDQQAWAEGCGEAAQARFTALFTASDFTKYDVDNVGVGPQGLGARASVIENTPTFSIPEQTGQLFTRAGNNLVLSINPGNPTGPLVIETYDPSLPAAQQWQRQEWDSSSGPRYVFINQQTHLAMSADGNQGDAITQTATLTSSNFWTLGGDAGNDFHAVQWANDNDQNLNIPGDGPWNAGDSVVTWSWGGGEPNEVWKFVVPNPVHTPGWLESAATYNGQNLYLSANPNNPDGQVVVELFASNSAEIWLRTANASSDSVTNYTYVNQLTGLTMFAPGNQGGAVSQTNVLSQNADWYEGGDAGNGYYAIPFGPDNNQNLNIPGNGPYPPGTGVVTWSWGGGAPNEIWRFLPAGAPVQRPCLIQSQLQYNGSYLVLSANPTNQTFEVVLEPFTPGNKSEVWIQYTIPRVSGSSYIYVNEASGLALWAPDGNGSSVTLKPYNLNSNGMYWNVASPFTSSWNALQYAPDENQNLNVFGDNSDYPGAVVGTWTWSGGAPNEVWQIVGDSQPPTLSLPSTISVHTDVGQNYATVTYNVGVSDNFGLATLTCEPASGSEFPIGTNYVYCQATDPSSNATPSESFEVIVKDTEAPTVYCPNNITVPTDPGQTNALVYFAALAFDNSGTATVTCTPAPGSTFPIGTTRVSCVAMDPSGNSATNSFTVTVQNVNPPNFASVGIGQKFPFQFTMAGVNGSSYQIEYTDTLNPANWQVLESFTLTNGATTVIDTNQVNQRYYRAVLLP